MVLPEFPLNVGKFLEVLRGETDLEVRVCVVVTPEAAASPSPILSGPLDLLRFRVPSPLSLDWAGFLFWASALEEPGRGGILLFLS